jgi:DNA-directed RNA polymerase subunit RPC12/RpoP
MSQQMVCWQTQRSKFMPRVDNSGSNVHEWCESPDNKYGSGSSTYDVCMRCYKHLKSDPHFYDEELKPYNGDPLGIDGWGGDVVHPPYEDDDYICAVCKRKLKESDDHGWD